MKYCILVLMMWLSVKAPAQSQPVGSSMKMDLENLINEALRNNPDIKATAHQMGVTRARVPQAGALDDPTLEFMRDEMPGFRWNDARFVKLELNQRFRFPSKLSQESDLAEIEAEHSHHEHLEKSNEVLALLKSAYYELWIVQQSIQLTEENARLLRQFTDVAQTKYGVGQVPQQDVLKAYVEIAKIENQLIALRQRELSTKSMLMSILNRNPKDTLGVATFPDSIVFKPSLETLQELALQSRPMLSHDSLGIEESRIRLSLAKKEFLPDFMLGLQYVTMPTGDFRGWTVKAGITLPFAPWSLGKASARVDEAAASVNRSTAVYNASRNMVLARVQDLFYKIQSSRRQLETYRVGVLPQARLSLQASMIAYQNGKTDFLMLIDAYRTLVDLSMESLMLRMEFEQGIAQLEQAVGLTDIASLEMKGNMK